MQSGQSNVFMVNCTANKNSKKKVYLAICLPWPRRVKISRRKDTRPLWENKSNWKKPRRNMTDSSQKKRQKKQLPERRRRMRLNRLLLKQQRTHRRQECWPLQTKQLPQSTCKTLRPILQQTFSNRCQWARARVNFLLPSQVEPLTMIQLRLIRVHLPPCKLLHLCLVHQLRLLQWPHQQILSQLFSRQLPRAKQRKPPLRRRQHQLYRHQHTHHQLQLPQHSLHHLFQLHQPLQPCNQTLTLLLPRIKLEKWPRNSEFHSLQISWRWSRTLRSRTP